MRADALPEGCSIRYMEPSKFLSCVLGIELIAASSHSYFKRWHADKSSSGGLMVHKVRWLAPSLLTSFTPNVM